MKACIDCKWCNWPEFATGDLTVIEITAACFHPRAKSSYSRVVGAGGAGRPCVLMRADVAAGATVCGSLGALWEGRDASRTVSA